MTFLGFCTSYNGDLIDPVDERLIYKRMIPQDLLSGLLAQNFNEQ